MTTCEKFILTYEPDYPKNNISVTDLTDLSTNCIKKLLIQKNYKLFTLKNIEIGIIDSIFNQMIYLNEEGNERTNITGNKVITLFLPNGIEIYSLYLSNASFIPDLLNPGTEVGKFKLTQVSEKVSFTDLEYILTKKNGEPSTRFLIFS